MTDEQGAATAPPDGGQRFMTVPLDDAVAEAARAHLRGGGGRHAFLSFPPHGGGLAPHEVAAVLERMTGEEMAQGRIHSPTTGGIDNRIRTGRVRWIPHAELGTSIFSHLFTLATVANSDRGWNFDLDGIARALQGVRYAGEAGEHYDWHTDWGNGNSGLRKITVVAHLADPAGFTGGELQLTTGRTPASVDQTAGAVTVFPTFVLHRVTPVTSGVRYAAVAWVLGPSFR